MRFVIIGLSIIFFSLSVIVTFKALQLPVDRISDRNNQTEVVPDSDHVIKTLIDDQEVNKALVADMQATIAQLENQLATKEDATTAKLENQLATKEDAQENLGNASDRQEDPQLLMVFDGTVFSSGQDVTDKIEFSVIRSLVEKILAAPDSQVSVEGHTDNIPTKPLTGRPYQDNMGLSFLRAKAIADMLVTQGIAREQISVIGYGETRPIVSNDTEDGRAKNRRVEVKLISEGENE